MVEVQDRLMWRVDKQMHGGVWVVQREPTGDQRIAEMWMNDCIFPTRLVELVTTERVVRHQETCIYCLKPLFFVEEKDLWLHKTGSHWCGEHNQLPATPHSAVVR